VHALWAAPTVVRTAVGPEATDVPGTGPEITRRWTPITGSPARGFFLLPHATGYVAIIVIKAVPDMNAPSQCYEIALTLWWGPAS